MVPRRSEYVSFKLLHKYAAMLKYHKGYGAAVDSLNVLVLRSCNVVNLRGNSSLFPTP